MDVLAIQEKLFFTVVYGSLLWVRILAVTAVVPFLFGKPVPRTVRVGVAFILMAFLYPKLKPDGIPEVVNDRLILTLLYIKEAVVGTIIGLGASILLYGFDAAGRMIDNQRGMSLARILIPQLNEMGSISGQFLFQFAIVMYLVLGGHLQFIATLAESYRAIPLFGFPNIEVGFWQLSLLFVTMAGQVITLSIQIAAPVILAVLITDIILAVTNRIAPQINVWEMGFNVKGYVGILMFFLSMTLIVKQMGTEMRQSQQNTQWLIELMQGKIPEPLREKPAPDETAIPAPTPTPELGR